MGFQQIVGARHVQHACVSAVLGSLKVLGGVGQQARRKGRAAASEEARQAAAAEERCARQKRDADTMDGEWCGSLDGSRASK